ncbi:hypothetical protein JTB14_010793 [Gonioctena quinquepunctata]|nr:hypothetical protein JTB14_010793 [Gonioctena quinquepunctata]
MAKKGFPCKKEDSAKQIFMYQGIIHLSITNQMMVGLSPPQISQRTSEGVTSASSCVSEADIRKWFADIQEYLIEEDLLDVISDSSRVFNETGFHIHMSTCPSTGKVFAKRGALKMKMIPMNMIPRKLRKISKVLPKKFIE